MESAGEKGNRPWQRYQNSKIILVKDEEQAMELLNEYAPEHLILACDNAERLPQRLSMQARFSWALFSRNVGDYASGTNHVLPTNGYAKIYSGVSVDSFMKKITFQQICRRRG